jgi:transposase InsO family protein
MWGQTLGYLTPSLASRSHTMWAARVKWTRWLYLSTIIDCFSRRVVGWAMADQLRTELPLTALRMALARRHPSGTLIHHTDRGCCPYTSEAYTNVLERHGVRSSLSRPGNCWDNAVAESFFSTLKLDLLYRHSWPTRAAARTAIFECIEGFYNRERRHTTLGNLSPADYESQHAAVCSA